jgi:SPP1 gp7 family putative phage head morphogenesis protein
MTKLLDPIRPNAGVEAAYSRKLRALVDEMHQSWLYWMTAAWRKTDMAMDAGPTRTLRRAMERLADQWQKRFDEIAPRLAETFAASSSKATTASMQAALKKAGLTVQFKPTRASIEAYNTVQAEQVNLIKSIPTQYLTQVQTDVWQAVNRGYDLSTLKSTIQKRYDLADYRASLIARDQSAKANAVIEATRRTELGIEEAVWLHSAGGKEPRPSHVAASGKRFKLATGMYLDGAYTWPGMEINCRCVSRAVIPGL